MSEEELASIVSDAESALAQMQSTVNEVLDFRAIESGMSSLKLNKELVVLSDVSVRFDCLLQCSEPLILTNSICWLLRW